MDSATEQIPPGSPPRLPSRHRAVWPWAAGLALFLGAMAPGSAAAPQGPPPDDQLPGWRIDFRLGAATASAADAFPVDIAHDGEDGIRRRPETARITPGGDIALPEIPIGERLQPGLLDVLARDPRANWELEGSSGTLTRRPRPEPSPTAADAIPMRLRSPGRVPAEADGCWMAVEILPGADKGAPRALGVTIHGWDRLLARVGAGVFAGDLTLRLRSRINGGEPVRLLQPIALVIPGDRVLPAKGELHPAGAKSLRVGTRATAQVQLESVRIDGPAPDQGVQPGWWLQVDDGGRDGAARVLCRLPLPLRDENPDGPVIFRLAEPEGRSDQDIWGWDTQGLPRGYYRDRAWDDRLILQRHIPGPEDRPVAGVRVRRHTYKTYLPDCPRTGSLGADVYWDPAAAGSPAEPRRRDRPDPATARETSLGTFPVRSGLRVSTDMPMTGEPWQVAAIIDLATIPGGERLGQALPDDLYADLVRDVPDADASPVKTIRLGRDPEPAGSGIVRYRSGSGGEAPSFEPKEVGAYRIRLNAAGDPAATAGEPRAAPPRELIDEFADAEVPVRVAIVGEPPAPPDLERPLKVFVDGQPIWWSLTGEPGFDRPHENQRSPDSGGAQVTSQRAISFRWAYPETDRRMLLRFQRFLTGGGDPAGGNEQPYNGQPPNPALVMVRRTAENPIDGEPVADGKILDMNKDAVDPDVFDLRVDIASLRTSAERNQARQLGPRPLAARFVMMRVDGGLEPSGRVYSRRFSVAVRSVIDELRDAVQSETLGLIALALVIAAVVAYRRWKKARRKVRAAAREAAEGDAAAPQAPAPAAQEPGWDYLGGVEPAPDAGDLPSPGRPAAPPPKPAPSGLSYLDDLSTDRGDSSPYLDG